MNHKTTVGSSYHPCHPTAWGSCRMIILTFDYRHDVLEWAQFFGLDDGKSALRVLELQGRPLGPWGGVRGGGYQHRSGAEGWI